MSLFLGKQVSYHFKVDPLTCLDTQKDEVRDIKKKALGNPMKYLFPKLGRKYE